MDVKDEHERNQEASFFGGFRSEGFPTMYAEHKTAAVVYVLEAGLILAFVILATAFLLILPAWRGLERLKLIIRIGACILIAGVITVANFGQEWEVGEVTAESAYKPGTHVELNMTLGVHLGLRSVNVTLKATEKPEPLKHEIIDYNEEFSWTWDQGRFGFGANAGRIQREFRDAQLKGTPLPILWVVDYFTIDGEGYRFGRFYRTAGWYAHIAMWTALPMWGLAVFLLHCAVQYGAILACCTGLLQILACVLWAVIRNPEPLFIPYGEEILTTHYGASFWATLVNGLICVVLGVLVFLLSEFRPDDTLLFFGLDPATGFEDTYVTREPEPTSNTDQAPDYEVTGGMEQSSEQMEMGLIEPQVSYHGFQQPHVPSTTQMILKRRPTVLSRYSRRLDAHVGHSRRPPPPPPRSYEQDDEQPMYVNRDNILPGYPNQSYQHHY